jgi:hypothetical protein
MQLEDIHNMIGRIEQRAMKSISTKDFGMFADAVYVDPYSEFHPDDSMLWLELMGEARNMGEDFFERLFVIRGGGAVLEENKKFGYVIKPVIGMNGWPTIEAYNSEKEPLNKYLDPLCRLLKQLRERVDANENTGK